MPKEILIIGCGHGGIQAASSLRQNGFDGRLLLISSDASLPYQKPPLSKAFLSRDMTDEQLLIRPKSFYQNQQIELLIGATVKNIDSQAKTIQLDDGTGMNWDELILATGSVPRRLSIPGAELDGVFYLRTLQDSEQIRNALDQAHKIAIIGGGYIGLEVAASARKANKKVTLLEAENRILKRVTSEFMSDFYQSVHQSHQVDIRTQTAIVDLQGKNGRVKQVRTDDGEVFPADIVIVGIGVMPAIQLAEAAGIDCDNGILVDNTCRTSVEHVWAIGDCTNHPNPIFKRRLRIESVPNAMEQARVVAANLTGQKKLHHAVPWFWSDQYHLKLQMAGFSSGADTEVLRGDKESEKFARFYWKDGALSGVDSVNCPQEFMFCRKLIEQAIKVEPAQLADPDIELKSLLAS